MEKNMEKGDDSGEKGHTASVDSQVILPGTSTLLSSQEPVSSLAKTMPLTPTVHQLPTVPAESPKLPNTLDSSPNPALASVPKSEIVSEALTDDGPTSAPSCPNLTGSESMSTPFVPPRPSVPSATLGRAISSPPVLPPFLMEPPAKSTNVSTFVGTLSSLYEAAQRQRKWAVIMILPSGSKLPFPPLPANDSVRDSILVWRRSASSSEASRYTAFFPVDGYPHIALLDPRTGERLLVWGNQDDVHMEDNMLSQELWASVETDLGIFITSHSLDDGVIGPVHLAEKPWSVRTRRVKDGDQMNDSTIPTSIMDDEEAAIAVAIAASLKDVDASRDVNMSDDEVNQSESNDDDDEDGESNSGKDRSDTFEESGVDGIFETGNDDDDDDDDDGASYSSASRSVLTSAALSTSERTELSSMMSFPCSPSPSRHGIDALPKPIVTPSAPRSAGQIGPSSKRQHEIFASSVDSVSSSYLDRVASCLRSSQDPALLETRRLRQAQDDELQAALQRDRELECKERIQSEADARIREIVENARIRLDSLLERRDCNNDLDMNVLLRFSDGHRVMKQLPSSVVFDVLRDVVTVESKGEMNIDRDVALVFRCPGVDLSHCLWSTHLTDAGLCSHTALFVLP